MAKTKYYIDYDYDEEKDGPSDGSIFRPFTTSMDAQEAAEKDGVDDFIFVELEPDNSGVKWLGLLNLTGCAAWSLVLLIGGGVLYFIIVTLVEFFRDLGL